MILSTTARNFIPRATLPFLYSRQQQQQRFVRSTNISRDISSSAGRSKIANQASSRANASTCNLAISRHYTKSTMPAAQQTIVAPSYCEDLIDPSQLELLAEECILVNDQDQIIGHDSKKRCHLVDPITGHIPLHRAFSVFLFNTKGELLLQQRSKTKITFPSMYSNTCCSHPLYTNDDELIENDGLGVKVAAQRRLYEELGIRKEQIPLNSFKYLTRVHYKANSGDSCWGEHEIDYILFIQADVNIQPNPNEVDDVRYMSLEEFQKFKSSDSIQFTPWFHLIAKSGKLQEWWNGMNDLKQFQDFEKIYRMF